jgi:hypothetical protein
MRLHPHFGIVLLGITVSVTGLSWFGSSGASSVLHKGGEDSGRASNNTPQRSKAFREREAPPRLKRQRLTEQEYRALAEELMEPPTESESPNEKRMQLHRVLVQWAKEDLQAATDFITGSRLGKMGNFWMTGVLASLAESNAPLAFSHGLLLNMARDRYIVNPSGLLKIATLHLGAEEVIAAMDQKRLVGGAIEETCLFPNDANFQEIGDAIRAKYSTAVANGEKWQPAVIPKNFVSAWAAYDGPAAYAYCVAMNGLQDEDRGREFIGYALGMADGSHATAGLAINALLTNDTLEFNREALAWTFVTGGAELSKLFLESVAGLAAEERDRMGSAAMERVVRFERGPQEGEMAACLKVMATDKARFEAARSASSRLPIFGVEAAVHLREMGYPEAVISGIISPGGSFPPTP